MLIPVVSSTCPVRIKKSDVASVRSSIARRLGIDIDALAPVDRHVECVVDMVLDTTGGCDLPLTPTRLSGWLTALFAIGLTSGLTRIQVGTWRDDANGPMQVASGQGLRQRVRKNYDNVLERTQKGIQNVTEWLLWFLGILASCIVLWIAPNRRLTTCWSKTRFWRHRSGTPMNQRQIKPLSRLFDGFDGKLTSSKWGAIANCSPDTALRHINELMALNLLRKMTGGGRSTAYAIVW